MLGGLTSGGRLPLSLGLGQGILLGQPFDGLLLGGGIGQALSPVWGACRRQIQVPRSLYIRRISTTGGRLLLR